MARRHIHHGHHEPEDQVVAELPLVTRDKAKKHYLGLTIPALPDYDTLFYDGLIDLSLDLIHYIAKR